MYIELPQSVENIIQTLEQHGHEAYAVGGCVRDCILGESPKDWDITTSAKPEEVKELFRHTIDTGIQHGTVTVMVDHVGYEVTTYRIDGEYSDGRHPNSVTFTPDLLEDLKRRDFTINAMAYHPTRGLVDEFDGVGDLEKHMIRAVGEPRQRFTEDALRMMRAIRFAARFGFAIEDETYDAICELAPSLEKVSAERIREEFLKTILSDHPEHIRLFRETHLTEVFLPEWNALCETEQNTPHHYLNVEDHTIEVMKNVPAEKNLRLAATFHDIAKPACKTTDEAGVDHFKGHPTAGAEITKQILRRLRFDNDTIDAVVRLVMWHDERPTDSERSVRRAMARIGLSAFPDLFALKRADTAGQSDYHRIEKYEAIDMFERRYAEILEKKQALTVKDLAIDGKDLLDLGVKRGPAIGKILKELLEEVLEDPEKNQKEILMEKAKGLKNLIVAICFIFAMSLLMGLTACGDSKAGQTLEGIPSGNPITGLSSDSKDEDSDDDSEDGTTLDDIYLIQKMDTENERLTLRNLSTDQVLRYSYTLGTSFKDKYGGSESWDSFQRGRAVEIETDGNTGVLTSVKLTDQLWEKNDITNFSVDAENLIFTIGSTNYRLTDATEVYSDDSVATLYDITESDTLRAVGFDNVVYSLMITTGHGYIELVNVELFQDSVAQIGDKIFTKISEEGMLIEVPEGNYNLTVANGGYGGTTEVAVQRNGTEVVDLDTLRGEGPKMCTITLTTTVTGAKIYIDNTQITANRPTQISYGSHNLTVVADGYDTWTRILVVNSPEAEILLDPTTTTESTTDSASTGTTNSTTSNTTDNSTNSSSSNNSSSTSSSSSSSSDASSSAADATVDYLTTLSEMTSMLMGLD